DTTLRQFQQAAEIRDAFFPTGGNQPTINLEVKPVTLSGEATSATLQINGSSVASQQGVNTPTTVQWPGAGAGAASIAMLPELPAKRDCGAAKLSRRLLEVWEPWLQASVATSRQVLGESWRDAYNSAPIWRFWLGASFCGEAVLGAFMASIDGVGRHFPLTVF